MSTQYKERTQYYYTLDGKQSRTGAVVVKSSNDRDQLHKLIPRKISNEQAMEIIKLFESGLSRNAIRTATEYTQWSIGKICANRVEIVRLITGA